MLGDDDSLVFARLLELDIADGEGRVDVNERSTGITALATGVYNA
jgi:hypothetical protein